jgi:inner membrane transporter RhtA
MSVNPVFAALVGLIVLHQHLDPAAWAAIWVIVGANAIAVTAGPGPASRP